jgi:hypothetical protein
MMDYLDKEEKKVIESYENDEWHSIRKEDQESYIKAAEKSSLKN